jgi:hypothetical protein
MSRWMHKPSPAMMVACVALLVALSGTGVAALSQLPRASVGTSQLKRNAVTPQKLAPNAVRTGHVLNGSLLAADFKEGQIPAGPQGPPGPTGPAGPPATSLWAHVAANGSIVRTSRTGFAATADGFGGGTVTFPVDVSACSFAVTIAAAPADTFGPIGEIKVFPPPISGNNARVFLSMTSDGDGLGEPTDQRGYFIQAFC